MSDQADQPSPYDEGEPAERPVLWGLVALLGVGLVIGLLAAGGVTVAVKVLGLGGDEGQAAAGGSSGEQSMYLPTPSPTTSGGEDGAGPLVSGAGKQPSESGSASEGTQPINLTAGQDSVGAMEQIDLTGDYDGGEGAVLQVQRKESGSWSDFPVTVTVSGGQFTTYVQTGQTGKNIFRVVDSNTGEASNPVTVQVG
ncbi:hypothetical protein K8W59_16330 [Nocardioides rotundus]|uniref:hypothetical protein n=1 Tax=Nocardioides rotundus TaxID=1774216 RepID=UPI001CBFB513|nr:hypothetical protein [Nocardioides rotundus]UAL29318.1 hypothetical protein K8W59_16330 [Nocardioides rotundus]